METTHRERKLLSENQRLRPEKEQLRQECDLLRREVDRFREQNHGLNELVAELKAALETTLARSATAPPTPSGQKPVYMKPSKPAGARRRKPPAAIPSARLGPT